MGQKLKLCMVCCRRKEVNKQVNIRKKIPEWFGHIQSVFLENGFPLYLVGGFVRNALMGIPEQDFDCTGPTHPQIIIEKLNGYKGIRVVPKILAFGTIEIFCDWNGERLGCEYTTFRKDHYQEGGNHIPEEVHFASTLEEDATRRDFTINALYYNVASHELFDPTGGKRDIEKKLIRTTSRDPYLVFKDDGLRLLRMIRFACQLKFTIHEETYQIAKDQINLLSDISMERIREEFVKILLSDVRYPTLPDLDGVPAHRRGLEFLLDTGAFWYMIPVVLDQHFIEACVGMPPKVHLRMAGLLHDIAKPLMQKQVDGIYGQDRKGAEVVRSIMGLTGLRFDNETIQKTMILVENQLLDFDHQADAAALRIKFASLGYETVMELIALRKSDGDGLSKWQDILMQMQEEGVPTSIAALAIDGRDIMEAMGSDSSPQIGKIKKRLYDHVVLHPEDNTREKLLRLLSR